MNIKFFFWLLLISLVFNAWYGFFSADTARKNVHRVVAIISLVMVIFWLCSGKLMA